MDGFTRGSRIGPYEAIEAIGAGGMGEVWKARDTRLDRMVAIKVSKDQFLDRFDREARAVAALNHPHICQLYDVGENYLVMEFVDGQPLKGPLRLDKVFDYGAQICDALIAAHARGIIHRDLKPSNILVTKSGIKLLDFGLAKLGARTEVEGATKTIALTRDNTILGTLQYMAPEQLEGNDADVRSDIFGFGAVLYELLTGKPAFPGTSQASVIAAILHKDPAPLPEGVPKALDRVTAKCLAKDPDRRWQSARDLMDELAWIAGGGDATPIAAAPARSWPRWIAWTAALAAIGAALFFVGARSGRQTGGEVMRLAINPPPGTIFTSGQTNTTVPTPRLALAPDGHAILFTAASAEGREGLWVRAFDDPVARLLPGTEAAGDACWSPDSAWIAFSSEGAIKKMPAGGGPIQTIASTVTTRGIAWSPDGTILFANGNIGLFRAPLSGGVAVPLTKLDPEASETSHRWPQFLPDGRRFLYTIRSAKADRRGVYVSSLDGNLKKLVLPSASSAVYVAPGYLLYVDGDTLTAREFDKDRLELRGQPISIAQPVGHAVLGFGAFSVSNAGILAYAAPLYRPAHLTWFDREGKTLGQVGAEGDYVDFRLSPDDSRLAASLQNTKTGYTDVWITDLARGSMALFGSGNFLTASATWSPDGSRILYRSLVNGVPELYMRTSAGGGQDESLLLEAKQREVLKDSNNTVSSDWSPDGRQILFSTLTSNWQLWTIPALPGGQATPVRLVDSTADVMHGSFSPDGKLVAYTSNESRTWEVYVQTFPPSDRKWKVSTEGGYDPHWRKDGGEIYYLSTDRKLTAVAVKGGPSFGVPKMLFQTRVPVGVNGARLNFAPARDGSRFLVNMQVGDPVPIPLTVVLNWTAALKQN